MDSKEIQDEIFKIRFWLNNMKDSIKLTEKGLVKIEKSLISEKGLTKIERCPISENQILTTSYSDDKDLSNLAKCTLEEFKNDI